MKRSLIVIIFALALMFTLPLLVSANRFNDVDEGKWYSAGIEFCDANGYMDGVAEGRFDRQSDLTRAMFMTILAKVDGVDLTSYEGKSSFKDVKIDGWYTAAIAWAAENDITGGIGDGIFGYKNAITREQMALFFYVYSAYVNQNDTVSDHGIDLSPRADLSSFEDTDHIHSWARNAMEWAVACGLIGGTGENTLSPRGNCTRAEAAVMIRAFVCDILSDCEHEWTKTDCETDGHCNICGIIAGKAYGHDFPAHSCLVMAYCNRCDDIEKPKEHTMVDLTCTVDNHCSVCGYVKEKAQGHKTYPSGGIYKCSVCGQYPSVHYRILQRLHKCTEKQSIALPHESSHEHGRLYYGDFFTGVDKYGYKYTLAIAVSDKYTNFDILYYIMDPDSSKILYNCRIMVQDYNAEAWNFAYKCPFGYLEGGFNRSINSSGNYYRYSNPRYDDLDSAVAAKMAGQDIVFILELFEGYLNNYYSASLSDYGFDTEALFGK